MNRLIKTPFKTFPILILISAFAPYISPTSGVKWDNIVIYVLAMAAVCIIVVRHNFLVNKHLIIVFLIWLSVFAFLSIRSLIGGGYISEYSLLAEIKNFSTPLAIMFLFIVFIYKHKMKSIEVILKKSSLVLVFLLTLNTLWIIIGINIDLSQINQYFVRGVSLNAASNNRLSGIFNQPMEAGISYSIGLFSWLYLVSKKDVNVNFKHILMLMLILIGGIFSVSKIFIIGGISIFFVNIILDKKIIFKLKKLILFMPMLILLISIYLTNNWQGLTYFSRLFVIENYREQGFLYLLSAGRYGGDSSQQNDLFGNIMDKSPFIGQGMGSQMVYDSAFFHFFSSGGLIALSFYILLLIYLFIISLLFFFYNSSRPETIFFISIVMLVVLSSFGAPVLTVNRASVVTWVFISLLLCFFNISHIKNSTDHRTLYN